MRMCEKCKKYGVLHTPMEIADGVYVYGFCFKDIRKNYGSAYPVYVPGNCVCKSFEKKKEKKDDYEYEMTQEFKCECCKKNLIESIVRLLEKM